MEEKKNMVEVQGEIIEQFENSSLLYYGALIVTIQSRHIARDLKLAASTVLGTRQLNLTITLDGRKLVAVTLSGPITLDGNELVRREDFPELTPFQSALFGLFGTLLAELTLTGGESRIRHQIYAVLSQPDEGFEALCAGLAGERVH